MWDCITLVDDATIAAIRELGGLAAIAISHPHFYASCITWSQAFGDCPVYIHAADAEWVQYPAPAVKLWEGETLEILPGHHPHQHRRPLRGLAGAPLGGRLRRARARC